MEINIIRGQNQIGGSIIEVSSKNTKIILDVGSNLEDKEIVVPEIEGLFKGKAKYDGVLTCVIQMNFLLKAVYYSIQCGKVIKKKKIRKSF